MLLIVTVTTMQNPLLTSQVKAWCTCVDIPATEDANLLFVEVGNDSMTAVPRQTRAARSCPGVLAERPRVHEPAFADSHLRMLMKAHNWRWNEAFSRWDRGVAGT